MKSLFWIACWWQLIENDHNVFYAAFYNLKKKTTINYKKIVQKKLSFYTKFNLTGKEQGKTGIL